MAVFVSALAVARLAKTTVTTKVRNLDMVRTRSDSSWDLFHERHQPSGTLGDKESVPDAVEFVPTDYFAPLDLPEVFPRPGLLEVDLGCGDGSFLVAMAQKAPDRNYLGIERMFGRVGSACARASRASVTNVRLLRVEISYAVKYLIPANSTSAAHLLFPDPWPKKRHQRRRIVTADFVAAVHRILVPDGFFNVATDQPDYFASICELIPNSGFREVSTERNADFPLTTFQKRFLTAGAPIYRLALRKTV